VQPERSVRPWVADASTPGGGTKPPPGVSLAMLRKHGTKRKTEPQIAGAAAIMISGVLDLESRERVFRRKRFPSGWQLGQRLNAQPAIRVGARRLAQYNLSELLSRKTSAPNLPNGGMLNSPRALRVARRFPKNRFMLLKVQCSGRLLVQVISQPSCSGVTLPVFHFQTSINSCRAKATIICLRPRRCIWGLSSTPRHFLTSQ